MKTLRNCRKLSALILVFAILATTIMGCMSAKAQIGATGVGLNDAVVARMTARIGAAGDAAGMLSQAYAEVGLSEIDGQAIPGSAAAWSALAHERSAAGNPIITLRGIGGDLSYEVAALDHMYQDGAAFYDKAGTLVVFQDRVAVSLGSAGTTEEEGVRAALAGSYGIDPGDYLRIENGTNPIFSLTVSEVLVVTNTNGSGVPVCAVLIPCATPAPVEETVEETTEEITETEELAEEQESVEIESEEETDAENTEETEDVTESSEETITEETESDEEAVSEEMETESSEEEITEIEETSEETVAETTEAAAETESSEEETEETVAETTTVEETETTAPEAESETEAETEVETEEETEEESEEAPLFSEIAEDSVFSEEELSMIDFSSCRLLVAGAEIIDPEHIISEYDGVYLLQYENSIITRNAYSYYYTRAAFVDVDSIISVAEGEGNESAVGSDEMTEQQNPLAELQEAVAENGTDIAGTVIALIDTGVNGVASVAESVSMVGDSVLDENGHGTEMAKLIYGKNPKARIISVKALGADGTGDASAVYAAIEYAISRNVDIINLSISAVKKAENAAIATAIAEAQARGIKVVAAAGNNGRNAGFYVPGGLPGVLTIGAAGKDGIRLSTSNYGDAVKVNVVAASTSEAAAIYSGLLSDGKGEIDRKLVFPVDYSVTAGPDVKAQVTILDKDFVLNREGAYAIPHQNYVEVIGGILHTVNDGSGLKTAVAASADISSVYRIEVYTNFISASEADITNECEIDYETMTVTIPEQYSGSDITVRWYQSENSYFYGAYGAFSAYSDMDSRFRVSWHDIEDNWSWGFGPASLAEQLTAHTYDIGTYNGDDSYKAGDSWTVTTWGVYNADDTCYKENGYQGIIDSSLYNKFRNMWMSGATAQWIVDFISVSPSSPSFLTTIGTPGTVWDPATGSAVGGRHTGEFMASPCAGQSTGGALSVGTGTITCISKTVSDGVTTATFKWGANATGQDVAGAFRVTYRTNGKLTLKKSSSNTKITDGNSAYDLTGAQYTVYTDDSYRTIAKTTSGENAVLTVKDNTGVTNTLEMAEGTYHVKETKAGKGYELDQNDHKVTVTAGKTETLEVKEVPIAGKATLIKSSSDTAVTNGNSTYDLTGTQYTVYTTKDCNTVAKTISGSDAVLTVKDNTGKTNTLEMAAGKYFAKETKAGKGYSIDNTPYEINVAPGKTATLEVKDAPSYGYLNMMKRSSDPKITDGNSCYNMTGIQYTVYTDAACTKVAKRADNKANAVFTLDKDGRAAAIPVAYGSYWIKETYNPEGSGYYMNTAPSDKIEVTVQNPNPGTKVMIDYPKNDPLSIVIEKEAAVPGAITDLSGCEYTIRYYKGQYETVNDLPAQADQEWRIKTNKTPAGKFKAALDDAHLVSGESGPFGKEVGSGYYIIPLGTLTVEETKAPYGFKTAGSEMYDVLTGVQFKKTGETFLFNLVDEYSGVFIKNNNQLSDGEDGIRIRQEELSLSPEIGTTASDAKSGTNHVLSQEDAVIVDTVSYKYLYANEDYILKGILMDRESGEPLLVDGHEVTAEKKFRTSSDTGKATVEFSFDATQAAGRALVVFETLYKAGSDVIEASHEDLHDEGQTIYIPSIGTTAIAENTNDHVTGEAQEITITDTISYKGLEVGRTYLMKGTLYDREFEAPLVVNGQKVYAETEFVPEAAEGTAPVTFTFSTIGLRGSALVAFEECYVEGSLVAVHADLQDESQTVYVPEIHTLAHDGKTEIDHTNAEKEAILIDTVFYSRLLPGREYEVKGRLINKATGEAFLDENGNEITASAVFTSETLTGTVDVTFTYDAAPIQGETIVVYETLYLKGVEIAAHTDITSQEQTDYVPELHTTALDLATEDHLSNAAEEVVILDEVFYRGLKPETKYAVRGSLFDQETGNPVLDAEGNEVTASTAFVTESSEETSLSGSVIVEFRFNGSNLKNRTIVAFEDLYTSEKLVGVHADLEDEAQTVFFPEIGTTAIDVEANSHVGHAGELIEIQDEVRYENLIPEKEYTISGLLMLKSGNEALLQDGEEIRSELTFIAEESSGTAVLSFFLNSEELSGETIVVFEDLLYNGAVIAKHADINDYEQSIHFPEIGTKASDTRTETNVGHLSSAVTVQDEIFYDNLIPGIEYAVSGILMDKEANAPLLQDGKEIRAAQSFIPENKSGRVVLSFTVDSQILSGKTIVVFEDLLYSGIVVTCHADIEDRDQSISFPKIGTTAKDTATGNHTGHLAETMTIQDEVQFENLIPGKEYTMSGVLMIRDDESVLRSRGAEARAEKTFIPDSSNGTVTIDFIIDSTRIAGRTVTAFEELKYNGILLAVHADINDEGQSVDFPKVWTTAKDVETGNHLGHLSETTEIQDEVFYTNLIPGKEYTVSGRLMVRSEGTALIQNEHEIRAEKTFIPEDRSGSVILSFTVDSTLLCGQTIVAFEDLIHNGVVIASHADIEDEEQSVHFPAAHTQARDEKKGGNVLTFGEGTVVIDTVLYENLIPGQTYTVKGVLMDRETGEATEITGEAEFVPETESGEVDVRFTLDVTAEMMNKSFVVFEEIYDENGILVAEHKDINDEAQTVNVVIGTADVPKPNPRRSETPILGIEKSFTVVFIVLAASILLTLGAAVLIRKKRG